MANRAFYQQVNNLVERLTFIQGEFLSAGGTISAVKGAGIQGVTRLATGQYLVQLQDSYNKFLGVEVCADEQGAAALGTPILLTTGLTNTTPFVITTLGTNVAGKTTITITSGAGLVTATVGGTTVSVTWTSTDNATATALSAALNASPAIAALVSTAPSTNTVVVTSLVNGGLGQVAVSVTGTGVTVSSALTVGQLSIAAQWQAVGFPVGLAPAVGAAFVTNSAGAQASASATAAAAPAAAGAAANSPAFSVLGNPDLTVNVQMQVGALAGATEKGGYFILESRLGTTGALSDVLSGQRVQFRVYLRNSSLKGRGE